MYTMLLLTALAQPAAEPEAVGGMAPQQALASIDAKGKLTITYLTCTCYGGNPDHTVDVVETRGTEKVTSKVKVKVSNLMVTTAELPAKHVEAYTADGRAISADKLATLLAKERTVLVAVDGKKVDPFHLQLYKDDTIVLMPPANALNMGGYVGGYGDAVPVPPPVEPKPAPAEDLKKPLPDDLKKPEDKEKDEKPRT
jgi:hypothetical protein